MRRSIYHFATLFLAVLPSFLSAQSTTPTSRPAAVDLKDPAALKAAMGTEVIVIGTVAISRALARAGRMSPAKSAMMAMTISNSTSENPRRTKCFKCLPDGRSNYAMEL
jgi:hypothetical protein